MRRFRVNLTPRAETHLDEIERWYRSELDGVPARFVEEFGNVIWLLSRNPELGVVYLPRRRQRIRRLLLSDSQYYVYYRVLRDEGVVWIEAIWRTSRGKRPPLS